MALQLAFELPLFTSTKIYDHIDYWPILLADLKKARGRIIIHTPYFTVKGIKRWLPEIQAAVARGVTVIIVLQRPRDFDFNTDDLDPSESVTMDEKELIIVSLRKAGAHVELRFDIHAKLVIIDEQILWEGSLNFLSHWNTTEHLRRSINRTEVREVMHRHKLNKTTEKNSDSEAYLREVIIARRDELGLTQRDLADSKLSQSYIAKLEKGVCRVLPILLSRLLDRIGFDAVFVPKYLRGPVDHFVKTQMAASKKQK